MADVARRLHEADTVDATVEEIVRVARDVAAGIQHAGFTIAHRDGTLETAASTDPLVDDLDRLQYGVGEGPCLDALRPEGAPVMVIDDIRTETRWPRFSGPAADLGLRAQMGVRVAVGDDVWGVLNLYSTEAGSIDADTRVVLELLAIHAPLAYGHVRTVTGLATALESRTVIGYAVGIVMERYGLSKERAFDYLVRVSSTSETKLRVVAEKLVAGGSDVASGLPASEAGSDVQDG